MEENFPNADIDYFDKIDELSIKWKGGYQFILRRGDLTEQETEVIVNAANDHLWLGGGVAGAIRRKGGDKIQKECNDIKSSTEEINEGDVFCSGIGNFDNKNLKYIFHAVGPVYRDGKKGEKEALTKAFLNCFIKANELKVESLSLPPISSGIFGYPKEECAKVFYECLKDYLESSLKNENLEKNMLNDNTLKLVVMTIIDHETFGVFKKVHKEYKLKIREIFTREREGDNSEDNILNSDSDKLLIEPTNKVILQNKIPIEKEGLTHGEEYLIKDTQTSTQDIDSKLIIQINEIVNKD